MSPETPRVPAAVAAQLLLRFGDDVGVPLDALLPLLRRRCRHRVSPPLPQLIFKPACSS